MKVEKWNFWSIILIGYPIRGQQYKTRKVLLSNYLFLYLFKFFLLKWVKCEVLQ